LGNLIIAGDVTGAAIRGDHFYWTNGTELGGGAGSGKWYNGTGVPDGGLGVDGDFYLRLDNGWVYNKITIWVYVANLTGPQGIQGLTGLTGATGANGATWLSGAGAPGAVGSNNDYYFRTDNSWVYLKTGGVWGYIANLTGLPATSTLYYVNSTAVTTYTYGNSTLSSLFYADQNVMALDENSGSANYFYMNYTSVTTFSQWIMREYYAGSSSHNIEFQLYNWDTAAWNTQYTITGQLDYNTVTIPVYTPTNYTSGGVVMARLYHVENGVSSHRLYIDYSWLLSGNNIGASSNLVGYAKYVFGSNNFSGSGNFTANNFDSINPIGAYSYMIYQDPGFATNGLYCAKAANGTVSFTSTNCSSVVENAKANGNDLFFTSGTYPISYNLTITANNFTMRGEGASSIIKLYANYTNLFQIYGNFTTIKDLTFDGDKAENSLQAAGHTTGCAIFIGYSASIPTIGTTVENCIFSNIPTHPIVEILGFKAGDTIVSHCKFYNNNFWDVAYAGSYGHSILSECISDTSAGFEIGGTSTGFDTCVGNTVIGPVVTATSIGIMVNGPFNTISGNTVSGVKYALEVTQHNNTITGNIFANSNNGYAVVFSGAVDNIFSDNSITSVTGGSKVGIGLTAVSTRNLFENNRFGNGITQGVAIIDAPSINNIFKNNYFTCTTPFYNFTNPFPSEIIKYNVGFVTENSFSGANTTATTAVINHGLASTANYVWVSFDSSAITGYTWTSSATQVTITPTGTLPASWTCYVKAEYVP
jgi:hypothetical protein